MRHRSNNHRQAHAERFSAFLAETLHSLGITHQQLASRLGMPRYTVDSWTRSEECRLPSPQNLTRLCAVMDQYQPGLGSQVFRTAGRTGQAIPEPDQTPRTPEPTRSIMKATPPTNLPLPITTFIGRIAQIERILQLLSQTRLLTLTGAGGVGKTRLALEVSTRLVDDFDGGVWFVDLTQFTDSSQVSKAVALALGVREEADRGLRDTLTTYLQTKHVMLILDNCEHLRAACAALVEHLLTTCPQLHILATSREVLWVRGEVAWRVPSLAVPDPHTPLTQAEVLSYESVQLFLDRARMAHPGFTIKPSQEKLLAQLCAHLDGIPLAIELVAAYVTTITLEQLTARLSSCIRTMIGRQQTTLPRHQTVWATLDWSYTLLSDTEQVLFRRLAVFTGGWSLDAAEEICAGTGVAREEILDMLLRLVNKSLVVVEEQAGNARYRYLEMVRDYALEKLRQAGEDETLRAQHCDWFLAFAERVQIMITHASSNDAALDCIEQEYMNLLAALRRSIKDGSIEQSIQLGAMLCHFWHIRGYWIDARTHLAELLALSEKREPSVARATILYTAGRLATYQGEYQAARSLLDESLALCQKLDYRRGMADVLIALGMMSREQGEYDAARMLYSQALTIYTEMHEKRDIAHALGSLGNLAYQQGDLLAAHDYYSQSLRLKQELQDIRGTAHALSGLGLVAARRGENRAARSFHEQSLTLRRKAGDRQDVAWSLLHLGSVEQSDGQVSEAIEHYRQSLMLFHELGHKRGLIDALERMASITPSPDLAARLLGAADSLRTAIGAARPSSNHDDQTRIINALHKRITPESFESAYTSGRIMALPDIIALAASRGVEQ